MGQEPYCYSYISVFQYLAQHDAFRQGAFGKGILEAYAVIMASHSGLTLHDIAQRSHYRPSTVRRHVAELLRYGLVELEDDHYYPDLTELEAKLGRVAAELGTKGKGKGDRQYHGLERERYSHYRRKREDKPA